MEDFDAMDYFDEILDEVRGHIEVDDKYTYIGDRLAGADNVKPYCVADSFCAGVENEKEGAVFTEAAFWLDCFYRYENGGLEDMVEQFLSNSEAETYEELIEECDEAEFSFDDYYCDYISGGAAGYHFLVKNDLTVSTDIHRHGPWSPQCSQGCWIHKDSGLRPSRSDPGHRRPCLPTGQTGCRC